MIKMHTVTCWVITPCSLVVGYQLFEVLFALTFRDTKVEALYSSDTQVSPHIEHNPESQ